MFFAKRAGSKYVDKGVIVTNQFDIGDLTVDGGYYSLDLSSVIPANAKAVFLSIRIRSTSVNDAFYVMPDLADPGYNEVYQRTQAANVIITFTALIDVTGKRSIKYSASSVEFNLISFNVLSYFV